MVYEPRDRFGKRGSEFAESGGAAGVLVACGTAELAEVDESTGVDVAAEVPITPAAVDASSAPASEGCALAIPSHAPPKPATATPANATFKSECRSLFNPRRRPAISPFSSPQWHHLAPRCLSVVCQRARKLLETEVCAGSCRADRHLYQCRVHLSGEAQSGRFRDEDSRSSTRQPSLAALQQPQSSGRSPLATRPSAKTDSSPPPSFPRGLPMLQGWTG